MKRAIVCMDVTKRTDNQRKQRPAVFAFFVSFAVGLTTFLLSQSTNAAESTPASTASGEGFGFDEQENQIHISLNGKPIVDFVFRDDKTPRPYFANARLVNGLQVTRNHPPIEGVDAIDHATMHPGIWLAFGDINGQDFWRNKAAMKHLRFASAPKVADERLTFATECRLMTSDGQSLGLMANDFTLTARPHGWLLVWSAEFRADQQPIIFGDQEEMGFGARVATPFTEKNGGLIRSSTGKQTAKQTWGQTANWCDYSGAGPQSGGIMLMASPNNFRKSWWHNRNYGFFAANPFGRKAMKQGEVSSVSIAPGNSMRITFGALIHDDHNLDHDAEFDTFKQLISN
ncbi:MAG: PmoA family protein [Planctomycetales bacterium]|nr:PmoA family protein [Planctomycetales bacterium]